MSAAAIPPRRALPLRLALVLTTTVGIGAPTVPCAAAQAAKAEVRSYPLGLRDSATTATIVRRLLSAAGTVVEDPAHNRLVVYDRPDVHRRIAEALEAMAVGARQVRITVT